MPAEHRTDHRRDDFRKSYKAQLEFILRKVIDPVINGGALHIKRKNERKAYAEVVFKFFFPECRIFIEKRGEKGQRLAFLQKYEGRVCGRDIIAKRNVKRASIESWVVSIE